MSLQTIFMQHLERFPICNFGMLVGVLMVVFALIYRASVLRHAADYWLELKFELRGTEIDYLRAYDGDFTLTDCISGDDSLDAVRIVRDDNYVITPNEASKQLIGEYRNKIAMPAKVLIIAIAVLASCLLQYIVSWLIFLI